MLTKILLLNMVFTISSVTGLDLGILQHHRRHLFVNFRKMVHAILLTDSSSEKHRLRVGEIPEDLMGRLYFLHLMLQIL